MALLIYANLIQCQADAPGLSRSVIAALVSPFLRSCISPIAHPMCIMKELDMSHIIIRTCIQVFGELKVLDMLQEKDADSVFNRLRVLLESIRIFVWINDEQRKKF